MKLSISDLKTDRHWRASTGLNEKKFSELVLIFEEKYQEIFQEGFEDKKARSPMESAVQNCEELLLLTLFSLKSGLTYDLLGVVLGMDGTTAKRNQEVGIRVLKEALRETGDAPRREFKTVKAFQDYFKDNDILIIDGTEQAIERPQDNVAQKQNYSGKKKLTPLKRQSSRI
jgi:hypothetical protein